MTTEIDKEALRVKYRAERDKRLRADGIEVATSAWLDAGDAPRGSVQIAHGLAEHAARYDRFARALNAAGFLAFADVWATGGDPAVVAAAMGDVPGVGATDTRSTGEVPVHVGERRERLLAVRRGEMPWQEVEAWRRSSHDEFGVAATRTALAERPDYAVVDAFLRRARRLALAEQLP